MTVLLAAVAAGAAALVVWAPPAAHARLAAVATGGGTRTDADQRRPTNRRIGAHRRGRRAATAVDPRALAVALELVAACLSAGRPLAEALSVVALGVDEPMAARLAAVATALRAGAAPGDAWGTWLDDEWMAPIARAMVRAGTSGAPVAATALRAAARARALARADAERAARAVGVWAVLPLGLCFLPAFVLVGVAPAVIALLGQVL